MNKEREELIFLQKVFREIQPKLGISVIEAFWLAIADRYPDWAWAIDVERFKHTDESYLMFPGEVHRLGTLSVSSDDIDLYSYPSRPRLDPDEM